jgi:hypothetical protein
LGKYCNLLFLNLESATLSFLLPAKIDKAIFHLAVIKEHYHIFKFKILFISNL